MNRLTARSGARTFLGLLAALGLVAALTMPAFAADDWATITGYADGTPENNSPATWEALTPEDDTCMDAGINGVDTYVLPDLPAGTTYTLVVVKAGSEQSAEQVNTIFGEPPLEGQTVWADSDGDGVFSGDDKGISHIIVCTLVTEVPPSEAPPSEAPPSEVAESELPAESEREDTLGGTPTPAPAVPNTAMAGGDVGQMPATVLSLVLVGALGAMVYVRLARQR